MLKIRIKPILLLLACCLSGQYAWGDKPAGGEGNTPAQSALPPWQEGCLDIHLINTGKGESTFYILPDGTTMLIDAASSLLRPEEVQPKPDGTLRPAQWIINYIRKVALRSDTRKLDYFLLTHFDADHIGGYDDTLPLGGDGSYRLNGAAEILDYYQVGTLIDRAWPDYDYPKKLDKETVMNYRRSAQYQQRTKGLKIERFAPGTDTQLVLKHNPAKYPAFHIRNLVANGEIWTGRGRETRCTFPPLDSITKDNMPAENLLCAAFKLTYGKFDYYAGGDLSFRGRSKYAWKDIERPVGPLVGDVEVMKANHHGSFDANDTPFLQALDPEAILVHVWRTVQPRAVTMRRMAEATKADIFTTNLDKNYAMDYGRDAERIKDRNVHIVVRVYPGGERYEIYTIADTDKDYRVKQKFGPYTCH